MVIGSKVMVVAKYLTHNNPFVRKGSQFLLTAPRAWHRLRAKPDEYCVHPPVLVNSVPKSGTHLLNQAVQGLPVRHNFGAHLSSMVSSVQFRQRSEQSTIGFIRSFTPAEVVRGHLMYQARYAEELSEQNVVHYFIYRDPRDVIVSASHYQRFMNRWHRLHRYFRECNDEEAILLLIQGFSDRRIRFPNIAERFASYCGWLDDPNTLAVRFEDLVSERQRDVLCKMAEFYSAKTVTPLDINKIVKHMARAINPDKSHTFRRGTPGQWREVFTPACVCSFKQIAGNLLIELGYEGDLQWQL